MGIFLVNEKCEAADQSGKNRVDVGVDTEDFATFAYEDEWFKDVKCSPSENPTAVWADKTIDYEEMRTILGIPEVAASFINGDDISENLYRLYPS
jgi:hypothetical protein